MKKPIRPKPELIKECEDPGSGPRYIEVDSSITMMDPIILAGILILSIIGALVKCK